MVELTDVLIVEKAVKLVANLAKEKEEASRKAAFAELAHHTNAVHDRVTQQSATTPYNPPLPKCKRLRKGPKASSFLKRTKSQHPTLQST